MKTLLIVLGVFLLILLIRGILNYNRYRRIIKLKERYYSHLRKDIEASEFLHVKNEIIELFRTAGLEDTSVFHQEPIGFGHLANTQISVFENIGNRRSDIVQIILNRFEEAIGIFHTRYKYCLRPAFILEFIVNLPKFVLEYLNINPKGNSLNYFQLIYWILSILIGLESLGITNLLSR